jgi:EpsI family protein
MIQRILILSALLLSASAYISRTSKMEPVPIQKSLSGFPVQVGSWQGSENIDLEMEALDLLKVSDYLNRQYTDPRRLSLGLYVGFYEKQQQGSTIHSPLHCLPGAGWNPIEKGRRNVLIRDEYSGRAGSESSPFRNIEINKIIIEKGLDRCLVFYWYQSHGKVIASEYFGKINTILDAIRYNRTDAALVRVIAPINNMDADSTATTEDAALDFVKTIFPLLEEYLPS